MAEITNYLYFCIMEKNKINDVVSKAEADIMREKVSGYLVCFIDGCPLHKTCLRWVVGQYANQQTVAYTAINPRNPMMGNDSCPKYREMVRVKMMRGMTQFYHEMPGFMERDIRNSLIAHFGRTRYFQMRKGERLITPDQQKVIEQVMRANNWQGPIKFDGEVEDYLW